VTLWTVGLFGEPEDEVGSPVADVAADLEAAGSGAEVAPVAQGAFGYAEEDAGLLEAEHLVAGVRTGSWGVGLCGHAELLVDGFDDVRRRSLLVGVCGREVRLQE
jgi:hypothetical protein